jgi:hypothetical protein
VLVNVYLSFTADFYTGFMEFIGKVEDLMKIQYIFLSLIFYRHIGISYKHTGAYLTRNHGYHPCSISYMVAINVE